jgi:hypothetical protein
MTMIAAAAAARAAATTTMMIVAAPEAVPIRDGVAIRKVMLKRPGEAGRTGANNAFS